MCFINIHYIIRPQFSRLQGNALYNKDSVLGNGKRRAWQGRSISISFILSSLFNGETFPVADFQEQNGYFYLAQIDIALRWREHAEHHFRSVFENEENSLQLFFGTHKTLVSLVILKLLLVVNKVVPNGIGLTLLQQIWSVFMSWLLQKYIDLRPWKFDPWCESDGVESEVERCESDGWPTCPQLGTFDGKCMQMWRLCAASVHQQSCSAQVVA